MHQGLLASDQVSFPAEPRKLESNSPALCGFWSHELADRPKQLLNLRIVRVEPPLQFIDLGGQLSVRRQHFPQPHESAHYIDAHLHGPLGVQHIGSHDGAVFGERMRQIAAPPVLPS